MGFYVAVGDYTTDLVHGTDFDNIIAIHGACTHTEKEAYTTLLKGIEAGNLLKFEGKTFEDIQGLAKGAIDITVKFYKAA